MKKFHFRLEKLLKYRRSLLHMVEMELMLKNSEILKLQESLKEYQISKKNSFNSYTTHTFQLDDMRRSEFLRKGLEQKINKLEDALRICEKDKIDISKRYTTLKSQYRAIELLKEKELSQYKTEMIRYREEIVNEVLLGRCLYDKQ